MDAARGWPQGALTFLCLRDLRVSETGREFRASRHESQSTARIPGLSTIRKPLPVLAALARLLRCLKKRPLLLRDRPVPAEMPFADRRRAVAVLLREARDGHAIRCD